MRKSILLFFGAALFVLYPSAIGQESQSVGTDSLSATTQRKPSLPLLYRHFLAYQNFLDRTAAEAQLRGEDLKEIRNHNQDQLRFTDKQFNAVRASALRLEATLKRQDAKAAEVIQAVRARFPQGRLQSPEDLPPVPPELKQLQAERNRLIESEMNVLRAALGEEASAKLDAFLQIEFASNLKVRYMAMPGSRMLPSGAQDFAQEVR